MENSQVRIAVVGAGLIGERHAHLVSSSEEAALAAIVDPSKSATKLARDLGVPHFSEVGEFFREDSDCDGLILATPNHTHGELAIACIENGVPCLIEKPMAATSREAAKIVEAVKKSGIPVLVGHHRRHHHQTIATKELIDSGELGRIVGAQLCWVLKKPASYFEADWRKSDGGGPIWINFIHEVDLLRFFFGEVLAVSAMLSNSIRGNPVEDSGVISLRFEEDVLVSAVISDAAPSPWSFEGASDENPNIAFTGQDGLRIFGTEGSVSFPSMRKWFYKSREGHWGTEISSEQPLEPFTMHGEIALGRQLQNFVEVLRGDAAPVVTAKDGYEAVRILELITEAARKNTIMKVCRN